MPRSGSRVSESVSGVADGFCKTCGTPGATTETLIESILSANAKGKIKIKHVDDNTADAVEILVHLPAGSDPEQIIQQLYVFTNCQMQLNPAACVIENDKPQFLGVREILKRSAEKTKALPKQELEIKQMVV